MTQLQVRGLRREENNVAHVENLTVEKPNDGRRMDDTGRSPVKDFKDCNSCIGMWNELSK